MIWATLRCSFTLPGSHFAVKTEKSSEKMEFSIVNWTHEDLFLLGFRARTF